MESANKLRLPRVHENVTLALRQSLFAFVGGLSLLIIFALTLHYFFAELFYQTTFSIYVAKSVVLLVFVAVFAYYTAHTFRNHYYKLGLDYQSVFEHHDSPMVIVELKSGKVIEYNRACHIVLQVQGSMAGVVIRKFLPAVDLDVLRSQLEGYTTLQHAALKDTLEIRWSHIEFKNKRCAMLIVKVISTSAATTSAHVSGLEEADMPYLHSAFHQSVCGFVIVNPDGTIHLCNDVMRLLILFRHQVLDKGSDLFSLLPSNMQSWFREMFSVAKETKRPVSQEYECMLEGTTFWYAVSFVPVLDNNNALLKISIRFNDITKQKRIEHHLSSKRRSLYALINSTKDILFSIDLKGRIMTVNTSFINFVLKEYSLIINAGESVGDYAFFDRSWLTLYQEGFIGSKEVSHTWINKSGTRKFYDVSISPVLDGEHVTGLVFFYRDITKRKRIEEKLVEINNRFLLLSMATNDAVGDFKINENHIEWNKGTKTIYGYAETELRTFRKWVKNIHPDEQQRLVDDIRRTLYVKASKWSYTCRYKCASGIYKNVFIRAFIMYRQGVIDRVIASMQDITNLIETEKAFHLSNERYRLASKATDDVIYDCDLLNSTIYWGEGYGTAFGYGDYQDEHVQHWLDKIHPDDLFHVITKRDVLLSHNGSEDKFQCEYRYKKVDGTYAYVIDRGYILRNEFNAPVRMIGALLDFTDRMNNLAEIKKLSLVASKTTNMVLVCNEGFDVEWVNDAFIRNTSLAFTSAIQTNVESLFTSLGSNTIIVNRLVRTLAGGGSARDEISISQHGKQRWFRVDADVILDDVLAKKRHIMIFTDITQQKVYENSILSIAKEMSTLIEHANAVIFGVDRNGYVNEWNKVSEQVTGFSKNDVYGRKLIGNIKSDADKQKFQILLSKVLSGEPVSNIELSINSKDTNETILLINATPRRNGDGVISGAFIVGQDITELFAYRTDLELKVAERTKKLNEALKKELELVDMKKRFVSVASHEFKTPLSTINFAAGYLKRYRQRLDAQAVEEKLSMIEQQVKHMTFLLEDVLSMDKYDAGTIQVKTSTINVYNFFTELIVEVSSAFGNSHHINFINGVGHCEMELDPKLMRNIFVNLFSNAIKFSPDEKEIEVAIRHCGHGIEFSVKDRGIGIDSSEHEKVFTAFHRAENANAIQGTGLGLHIAKRAVELLNGSITLESEKGKGSTFKIILPGDGTKTCFVG